jgi:acetylornithine/N-succinyldiaminopimelate aminotransferase
MSESKSSAWIERARGPLMLTQGRYPLVLERGEGCRVWDVDGKKYLDFLGGLAVASLGHAPRALQEALAKQAAQIVQTSNFTLNVPQIELAEWLVAHSPFDQVFFCNSGAEANEAAFKLARKWGKKERNGAYRIISTENSFHGRTLATVAATGTVAYRTPFEPLPEGFDFVPFSNIDAMADAVADDTVAVVLEPIQAEGGVNVPEANYLKDVRALCDERHLMLIFDEVQTGVGRCGSLWAHTQWAVEPDVMTLAKGLASGFPIGATLAKMRYSVFEPGDHNSTFGGNPLACATALAVQREIEARGLVANAADVGAYLIDRLTALKPKFPAVKEVRGRGLLVALELSTENARDILSRLRERGLMANALNARTLRFIPPLIVTRAEVDEAVAILEQVLGEP